MIRIPSLFVLLAFILPLRADEPPLEAVYSREPIAEGEAALDAPVWKQAPAYPLKVVHREEQEPIPLNEGGVVQFAWDEEHLHVRATLEDRDLVAENDNDHAHHYRFGDVVELFLKPPEKLCYWELYGTPRGSQSVFFYPARGRMLPSALGAAGLDLKVAVRIDGTLNQWRDNDHGWAVVFAVPLKTLRAEGGELASDGKPWSVLVARYNYSAYHEVLGGELSSTSGKGADVHSGKGANFHLYEKWQPLLLKK